MDADRVLRLIEQAGLEDDPELQQLAKVITHAPDTRTAAYAERILTHRVATHLQHPFTEHDAALPRDTDLDLGTTFTGSPFTVDESVLTRHMLVTGQSGTGKTTLLYTVMGEVSVPWWAFDLKTDYRHLLTQPGLSDLVVLPWERLRVNPLQPPPGVTPRRWAQTIQELFGDAYDLLSGSQHYLLTHLLECYRAYGMDVTASATTDTAFPAFHDLRRFIHEDGATGRVRTQYKERLIDRLAAVTAATDPLYDCSTGYDLASLLQRNVVFEFDGLASAHQDFLMEYLLSWVYQYRDAHQQRGDRLRHVFILDEGKRVFSVFKERSDAKGLPQIDVLTDTMREFGEGLVVADQEPKKLTDSIVANTHVKVLFPIGDAAQFRAVAAAMRLTDRQRDVAYDLGTGQGIVRVGTNGPYPVQFHDFTVEKTVSDTRLAQHMASDWADLAFTPRGDTAPAETSLETVDEPDDPGETGDSREDSADDDPALTDAADRLLHDIVEVPFAKLTDRYSRLFSSRYKGNKAKKELLAAGLVRERQVEKKYGRPTLLELTRTGRELLRTQGVTVQRTGRGGVVHRYWQDLLKHRFEDAGYAAMREQDDADVAVELGDGRLAVEVAMEVAEREVQHVRDRLENGFDAVWIGCRSDRVREGVEALMEESGLPGDRVRVRLLQELQTASLDGL